MVITKIGKYRYKKVEGKWQRQDPKTGRVVKKYVPWTEMKRLFTKEYDRQLVNRVMKRQRMKGKDGRKIAKGLVKAYRLGKIGAEALY